MRDMGSAQRVDEQLLDGPGTPAGQPVPARETPVSAQEVATATGRFLTRLDRMSALLERMELDDHRMTALHRRAVVREFLQSARDCHSALERFQSGLPLSRGSQE